MRKIIASISIILVFTILCGCSGISRPEGFQDVQNIVSVDYQFADSQTSDDHYSFDLERGVFRFTRDADRNSPEYELEQSDEYELKQSDIESIRSAFEPAENWAQHYKYSYFAIAGIIGGASYTLGYIFLIVVFTYLAINGEGIH